ncbi:MAG: hypothetical protein LBB55_07085 [Zoogloeaceae bacterium]|jgi:hypothetical protein|nr:hypothetical protein [Zoogloeaceae bacterium]
MLRQRFLPLFSVTPDMVLARPMIVSEMGRVVLNLPAGHVLSQANLAQLRAHHAQYVCVQEEDTRGQMVRERNEMDQIQRMQTIFARAELGDPDTRAFFDAVLAYRASYS